MVSGWWACTQITNQKSVGRFPLTSRHESPASSDRMTSQCFCMNSTLGREPCDAMRWTQCPISALGSGMYCECRPRLIGFQVVPPSSERNAPAAEMATYIRRGLLGSSRDRKSTRLNSSHSQISYAVFCLKKKKKQKHNTAS